MKPPGRKPRPPELAQSYRVKIALTPGEYTALLAAARRNEPPATAARRILTAALGCKCDMSQRQAVTLGKK